MPRIYDWLAEIGLAKYAGEFVAAEIDYDTLPQLREADLKELQIPLGPRRKIWMAIQKLPALQSAKPTQTSQDIVSLTQSIRPASQAERRHLTVMFVDLVGSTEMVMRMDAEDMRDIITTYQNAVASVVQQYKGFVATLMGDGIMCYFGWPYANEDDTERAVRAGLAIIAATRDIKTPDGTELAARVGVATGIVVVGDLIGAGARQEAAVVGETPNLAARLQSIAAPNQLVVPSEALQLLGSMFDVVSLGPQDLKGVGRSVEAFAVRGETSVENRFRARRSGMLTPIVGRDAEVAAILEQWENTKAGRGQLVLLSGEAGIGKSRIVQAVKDAISSDDHTRANYQCSPYHSESAFFPVIQNLRKAARFSEDDTDEERLSKLEKTVGVDTNSNALVARLMGIDGASRYGPVNDTPTGQRAQLIRTLVAEMGRIAAKKPFLLIFEDLHWSDPTSLELLQAALGALAGQKAMVLATTRPTTSYVFENHPALSKITLERLDKDKTYAIVNKLTGGKKLPDEIMQAIARRTDGVPLFVEELTKTILESGVVKESGTGYRISNTLTDVAIPATLHDSLMARLDRLKSTKEIAQIAACIGREFSHNLIAQISDLPNPKLKAALNQLVSAELISQSHSDPAARYQFKHALVRDAAYESLLRKRRIEVHKRILSALERESQSAPELLATHAEAARLDDRAIELWEAAGKNAISRPAYTECEVHLVRAITLNAPKVATGDKEALAKAVALKVQLFVAQSADIGFWADETVATLEEALALADQLGETPLRGDIIYGLVLSTYFRGSLESSVARADEFNSLASAADDTAQLLVTKRLAGVGRLMMGRIGQAQPYLDEADSLCAAVEDQDLAARFGHDPVVGVKIYQSLSATFRGETGCAERYRVDALERAQHVNHTNTTCTMYGLALACAHVANDIVAERRHLTSMRHLVQKHAITASHLWAEVALALLKMADGDCSALEEYRNAEANMVDANIRLLVPGNRVLAARRAIDLGMVDEATEMAIAAETMMNETGEQSWLPDLHRLRATLALHNNDKDHAERHLRTAMKIAHKNGGTLWELRAAIDLSKLYRDNGRAPEAKALVKPVASRIKQGDCAPEMQYIWSLLHDHKVAVS